MYIEETLNTKLQSLIYYDLCPLFMHIWMLIVFKE